MIPPLDPFALSFDSIDIDPARAPTMQAIESALAMCAPSAAAPDREAAGFRLLDDAHGRFEVDRITGVVTLRDDALLARERNAVHGVRLRVVEPSGAIYELDLRLRLTGLVPQVVGAEEFDFGRDLSAAPVSHAAAPRRLPWAEFTAAAGVEAAAAPAPRDAPGLFIRAPLPRVPAGPAALALDERPPALASAHAAWSL
jgi:hypothetical protein